METLSTRQSKSLNKLEELMGQFSFELKHINGKNNVLADYAPRCTVNSIQARVSALTISPSNASWPFLQNKTSFSNKTLMPSKTT